MENLSNLTYQNYVDGLIVLNGKIIKLDPQKTYIFGNNTEEFMKHSTFVDCVYIEHKDLCTLNVIQLVLKFNDRSRKWNIYLQDTSDDILLKNIYTKDFTIMGILNEKGSKKVRKNFINWNDMVELNCNDSFKLCNSVETFPYIFRKVLKFKGIAYSYKSLKI